MKLLIFITLVCSALTALAHDHYLHAYHHNGFHGHNKHRPPFSYISETTTSTAATTTTATAVRFNPRRCFIDACPRGFLARRGDAVRICSRLTARQATNIAVSTAVPFWARTYCSDITSLSSACSCVASGKAAMASGKAAMASGKAAMASARASSSSSSAPSSISAGSIETTWSGPSLTLPPEDLQSSTAGMQANTKLAKRADAPCLPSPGLQYTTGGKTFRIICGADNNVNSFHSAPAANPKECADLCARQQGCFAASYTSACWFKDKLGVVQSSGVGTVFILPDTVSVSSETKGTSTTTSNVAASNPTFSNTPAGSTTNTQEQNPSEIKENDPSPPDSDRPEFTFVQDDQQQSQPDQNQQQTTTTQQGQNQQITDAPKQDNSQQGQGDGPSEITENGPSPESDDRPEFTFVQEDGQQDQQQTQQNQQVQQSTQPQSQPTQQPTQQQDQGPSEIKENDPSPADSDRPEFTFVQEENSQDQQQNQQQNQQDQQQTQQGQTQNQQNQQQQEQNPSEIKETDPNRESDERPEFTFVEEKQSGQQGQEQSQQQASQTQQPQQSPSQPQQEQTPTEIKETDPNRLSDDFPEFTFLEGQFINKMKRWFDYYPKAYRV